jgi:hypothetical protein
MLMLKLINYERRIVLENKIQSKIQNKGAEPEPQKGGGARATKTKISWEYNYRKATFTCNTLN